MKDKNMTMADLMARIDWTNVAESDRWRALMAAEMSDALVNLVYGAFTRAKQIIDRLGRRPARHPWRKASNAPRRAWGRSASCCHVVPDAQ
jgi:hypothetical protein